MTFDIRLAWLNETSTACLQFHGLSCVAEIPAPYVTVKSLRDRE